MRVLVKSFKEQMKSSVVQRVVTDVYKIELLEFVPNRQAYLCLRYNQSNACKKLVAGANYLIDKIQLQINK